MYVVCAVGSLVGFGLEGFLTYVVITIIFIVMTLIFRPEVDEERNEKQRLGSILLISTFVVQASKMFFSMFLIYDLLQSLMLAISAYIFYKIFSNSILLIKEYNIKKAFSIEEVIGTSLLFAIAIESLSGIKVFNLSVSNILNMVIVLFLGWRNGMLVGATSGITIGMVIRNYRRRETGFNSFICNFWNGGWNIK